MSKQYQNGDTVYVAVIHSTYTLATDIWAQADADENYPKITIIDPDGATQVDASSLTKKDTGKYEYLYTLPADSEGTWRGFIDTMNGTYPNRSHFSFVVGV